jgi:urease accessory protein
MGGDSARITAADFVTPPELRPLSLAAHGAGRIGGVRLGLAAGPRGTRLGACYQQVPLRVLPLHLGDDQPALVYLLNPTAGLMDGDGHLVELHAGPGARAVIAGQSATRIHPCLAGLAAQRWSVRVEAGAVLAVLPGPAIPFVGSRYSQDVNIDLDDGAGLVWGDLWFAGRYARGDASEQFRFETIVQSFTVRRQGRPVFRDRFCWRGPWDETTAAWHFGGHPACGSVFATGRFPVAEHTGPRGACLRTAAGDTCWRWAGPAEAVTQAVVGTALRLAAALAGQGRPWLLGRHDLAPTHWFSMGARSAREGG